MKVGCAFSLPLAALSISSQMSLISWGSAIVLFSSSIPVTLDRDGSALNARILAAETLSTDLRAASSLSAAASPLCFVDSVVSSSKPGAVLSERVFTLAMSNFPGLYSTTKPTVLMLAKIDSVGQEC